MCQRALGIFSMLRLATGPTVLLAAGVLFVCVFVCVSVCVCKHVTIGMLSHGIRVFNTFTPTLSYSSTRHGEEHHHHLHHLHPQPQLVGPEMQGCPQGGVRPCANLMCEAPLIGYFYLREIMLYYKLLVHVKQYARLYIT